MSMFSGGELARHFGRLFLIYLAAAFVGGALTVAVAWYISD